MDFQRFVRELPELYEDWGLSSVRPKDDVHRKLLLYIGGMSTPSILQLLNFAVDCMAPDEVYCEVGCYHGSTLIGALYGNDGRMGYAVDNFSEFDDTGDNQAKLMQNLETFGLSDRVAFSNQDFEEFFYSLAAIETEDKIGVYLYDGAHDYRSQMMGLMLVKPFLSDQALIIVDDANWPSVKQANWDFIAGHPQCQMLLDLPTTSNSQDDFWNGIQVLSWDARRVTPCDPTVIQEQRQPALIKAIYDIGSLD